MNEERNTTMTTQVSNRQPPAEPEGESTQVDLAVEGMTCGSCASRVQRAVAKVPGVTEAGVNFATGRARVRFDPTLAGLDDLAAAVARSGYTVVPTQPEESGQDREDAERERDRQESVEQRRWPVRTSVAWPLGLATMALAFFVPGGSEEPGLRWAQLALAAPAQFYSGWPFLVGAVRRARARSVNMDTLVSLGTLAAFLYSTWALLTGRPRAPAKSVCRPLTCGFVAV